jgi:MOSC domain-containing protein YiiM
VDERSESRYLTILAAALVLGGVGLDWATHRLWVDRFDSARSATDLQVAWHGVRALLPLALLAAALWVLPRRRDVSTALALTVTLVAALSVFGFRATLRASGRDRPDLWPLGPSRETVQLWAAVLGTFVAATISRMPSRRRGAPVAPRASDDRAPQGRVESINVSDGGVPKASRPSARITATGVEGDRQRRLEGHGGPDRAVTLYSLERLDALRAEGHPIGPGTTGENLTIAGLPWDRVQAGVRLAVGDVLLELTKPAPPCQTIAGSFVDGRFQRISEKLHPGWSRYCARVLREGDVRVGDAVSLVED